MSDNVLISVAGNGHSDAHAWLSGGIAESDLKRCLKSDLACERYAMALVDSRADEMAVTVTKLCSTLSEKEQRRHGPEDLLIAYREGALDGIAQYLLEHKLNGESAPTRRTGGIGAPSADPAARPPEVTFEHQILLLVLRCKNTQDRVRLFYSIHHGGKAEADKAPLLIGLDLALSNGFVTYGTGNASAKAWSRGTSDELLYLTKAGKEWMRSQDLGRSDFGSARVYKEIMTYARATGPGVLAEMQLGAGGEGELSGGAETFSVLVPQKDFKEKFLGKTTMNGSIQPVAPGFAYYWTREQAIELAKPWPGAKITTIPKWDAQTKAYTYTVVG